MGRNLLRPVNSGIIPVNAVDTAVVMAEQVRQNTEELRVILQVEDTELALKSQFIDTFDEIISEDCMEGTHDTQASHICT